MTQKTDQYIILQLIRTNNPEVALRDSQPKDRAFILKYLRYFDRFQTNDCILVGIPNVMLLQMRHEWINTEGFDFILTDILKDCIARYIGHQSWKSMMSKTISHAKYLEMARDRIRKVGIKQVSSGKQLFSVKSSFSSLVDSITDHVMNYNDQYVTAAIKGSGKIAEEEFELTLAILLEEIRTQPSLKDKLLKHEISFVPVHHISRTLYVWYFRQIMPSAIVAKYASRLPKLYRRETYGDTPMALIDYKNNSATGLVDIQEIPDHSEEDYVD